MHQNDQKGKNERNVIHGNVDKNILLRFWLRANVRHLLNLYLWSGDRSQC